MSVIGLSLSQTQTFVALRSVLLAILPPCTEVILGQVNRVPEPKVLDFVVMTPLRRDRIETNVDTYSDAVFVASIANETMTVASVSLGTIVIGAALFGVGLLSGSKICEFVSGVNGGPGTYRIDPCQTVATETMAAGTSQLMQPTKFTAQLDVHGPNSADNAQVISTIFRDAYGVDLFNAIDANITPLYADDPHQMPFFNDQQQYEDRWVIEAVIQANQAVLISQQFFDGITVNLIDVDADYPPTGAP